MGLFSDITSALGSVFGNNSQPSSDANDSLKKKQNNPNVPIVNNNLTASKINLPKPLVNALGPPKPIVPVITPLVNNTNLTAQPIAPPPAQSGGLFHDLTHNPVTNMVGKDLADTGSEYLSNGLGALRGVVGLGQQGISVAKNDLGNNPSSPYIRGINNIAPIINKPAKALDIAATHAGPAAPVAYKAAQIVTNLATGAIGGEAAVGEDAEEAASKIPDETAPTTTENAPPETGTKGPEEPTPTNAPTNEPGKPIAQPGATESGVKPNPDAPAPVRPGSYQEAVRVAQPADTSPEALGEAPQVTPPPVEQTPQAPVETPTPEVAAPPKAPAIAPGQAASEAVAASPEQQAVVDEAVNNEPAYLRRPREIAAQAKATADTAAAEKAAAPDIDKIPTFQHNQNIKAVIEDGNNQLNDWAEAHPNATSRQIQEAKDSITKQVTDKVNELQKARHGAAPAEPTPEPPERQSAPPPPVDANDLNTPAYQRTSAKAAQAAKEVADKEAEAEKVAPTTEVDKTPAFQHQQNLKDVITKGNDELNEFVEAHPDATPQEIDAAKQAITSQVTATIQKLQDARYGGAAEETSKTELPKDTANVKFEQTENPLKGEESRSQEATPAEAKARTTLKETGDPMTNLENALQVAHDEIDNGTSNTSENLEHLLRKGTNGSKAGDVIGEQAQNALDKVLTKEQQRNVINALQSNTTKDLTGDEAKVADMIQRHVYEPSDTLRGTRDPEYERDPNYSTQIRKGRGASAPKSDGSAVIKGKSSVFDKLNRRGRFSYSRTTGKFTSGNDVKYGSANDLGLRAKGDTYVDKNGKVYNFSHATNQELEDNAGMKFHNLSSTLRAHISDTADLKFRSQAIDEMVKNPEKFNLSKTADETHDVPVTLKGEGGESHDLYTDADTQKLIDDTGLTGKGRPTPSLGTRLWNKAQSIVLQSTIQNPIWHGIGNQGVQAMIVSGERAGGVGGLKFLVDNPDADVTLRRLEAGGNVPTMGKDAPGLLSKLTYGGSKANAKMTAYLDNLMRDKAFDSLTKGKNAMTDDAAAKKVDQFMGDRKVLNDMQPHLDFFWHYYETMIKALGHTAADTVMGHPGVLANAAIATGTIYALDKAWQKWSGNLGAYVHPFGEVGVASSLVGSLKDLAKHEYSNALTTVTDRVSPLVSQAAEQVLGVNSYGEKFQNGSQRVQNLSNLSPAVGAFMSTGKSDAEKGLNYLGIYTPHVKGAMATNNKALAPILNTKGAQNDKSPGFPNDFTGEQGAKSYYAGVDKSLQGLSSHDADVLKEYYDTQVNQNGQKVKTGVVGGYSNATNLVTNDDKGGQALKHLYANEHSQPGNDPLWSLPLYAPVGQPSVKNFLDIEAKPEGYEKDGTIQKMQGSAVGTNGWYDQLNAQRTKYYSQFPPSKDATDEPPYPVFDQQTTADINAADNITDPTKFSQYLDANPDVASAFAATANWTNQIRALEGAPPQEAAIGVSPQLTQIIKTYSALPLSKTAGNTDTATSGERSAWINANPTEYNQMIQYFAQSDMRGVIENSIKAEYSGQGVNSQSLLKDTKSAGSDIVQNSNGTYSLNAPAASAAAYGSGSSSTSASAAAYDRDKAAGLSDLGTKYSTKAKVTGLKASTKKFTPPKLLDDKAPSGKNGNPFVQAITTTKGVKQRKGGDNIYAANISDTKGVKTA